MIFAYLTMLKAVLTFIAVIFTAQTLAGQNLIANKVLIEKSKRQLTLYAGDKLIGSFVVALGRSPVGDKQRPSRLKA